MVPTRSAHTASGRRRGWLRRPRTGGMAALSGMRRVMSLRWPPGQRYRQRALILLDGQVVLRARPGTADRARTRLAPPFSARTCELSITTMDRFSGPAASGLASSSCDCSHSPTSGQSRSRHQHVIPDRTQLLGKNSYGPAGQDKQDAAQDFQSHPAACAPDTGTAAQPAAIAAMKHDCTVLGENAMIQLSLVISASSER